MADVDINTMTTTIEFEPEDASVVEDASVAEGAAQQMAAIAELRALLRPVIIELLEDELSSYLRMRG